MSREPIEQTRPISVFNYWFLIILQVAITAILVVICAITRQLWIALLSIPVCFLVNLFWFFAKRNSTGLLVFWLLLGVSFPGLFILIPEHYIPFWLRLAFGIGLFGFCWLGLWYSSRILTKNYWWWAFMPGMILLSVGMCFAFSNRELLDLVFYIGGGTGLGLLGWGLGERLLGLIIAGSLTLTTAPGAAFSINYLQPGTVLTQLGIMLIWFAMGWGLITISSRVNSEKYLWWPLIPGGIFGVVGLGLYFGGDPKIASAILSNTGALGVMIFAGYLVLFRTKFRK